MGTAKELSADTLTADDASAHGDKGKVAAKMPGVVWVMFVALLLDLIAFTMILPLLPGLLDFYGHNDSGGLYSSLKSGVGYFREIVGAPDTPRWNSVLFGGLIGSLFSMLQYLASPILGAMSDVYGRRPVLLVSTLGIGASYLLWAASGSFTIFVLSRIIGGISKGNVSLSIAIVTDVLPEERRGKGMALVGVAFSLGFLIGPMIGAYFSKVMRSGDMADHFYVVPACFALTLTVIDIVFIFAAFKETLPENKRAKSLGSGIQGACNYISPKSIFRFSAVKGTTDKDLSSLRRIGAVYFLYLFIYAGLEFTLTFFVHNRFNYDSMQQGKMFFFMGCVMILVQGGYVRRLKKGQEQKLILKAMFLLIPAFLLIAVAYNTAVFYLGLTLFAFASSTVVPCLTTLVSSFGRADQKGTILGIFRSLGALARALGPVVACTVYWCAGALTCYVIGGLAILVPLYMFKTIKLEHKD